MITIGIADRNQTYCQGLKTMLDQIEGIRVMILNPLSFSLQMGGNPCIDILMVDEDLYHFRKSQVREAEKSLTAMKTIILTMDRDEHLNLPGMPEMMHKGSGKSEFAKHIRELSSPYYKYKIL